MTQNEKQTTEKPHSDLSGGFTQGKKLLCRGLAASPGSAVGRVVFIPGTAQISKVADGDIIVAKMTTPDMVSALRKAGAVVTDEGGRTCHAAILSRELGIPCIVGARNATKILSEGQRVLVDATRGVVFQTDEETEQETAQSPRTASVSKAFSLGSSLSPTPPGAEQLPGVTATKLLLNIEGPAAIDRLASLPADGVGLLRTEFIFSGEVGTHPMHLVRTKQGSLFVDKLAEGMSTVARAFYPRPVLARFSDFRTNDFRKLQGGQELEPDESNPMLGWRGASRYISPDYEEGFRLECRAVKKVRDEMGNTNLSVIVPFVRTLKEMERIKALLASEGLVSDASFKIWLMAEVPSVVFQADAFASMVDGITIGTNDLTQLILGVDRDSAALGSMGYFDERDPAVLRAVSLVIEAARRAGIPCSVCGEGPSVFPDFAEHLVRKGIDSISVNSDALDYTRRIVASVEQKIILDALRGK
jgi:pyruvate,water dikinase